MENLNNNNENNENKIEIQIKFEDKINKKILICQINRASSQYQSDFISIVALYMLKYA